MIVLSCSNLCLLFLFSLPGYHLYLLVIGQTTNENLRGVYAGRANPYNRGCCGNVLFTCCSDIPPSRLPDQSAILSAEEFINILYPGLENEESNWESSDAEAIESNTMAGGDGDGVDSGGQLSLSLSHSNTPSGGRMLLHTPVKRPHTDAAASPASSPMTPTNGTPTNGTPTVMARPASSAMNAGM